ncbi:MAG: hypothetical protein ACI4MS_00400 [Candidatus Coproplasma sp.]
MGGVRCGNPQSFTTFVNSFGFSSLSCSRSYLRRGTCPNAVEIFQRDLVGCGR